MAAQVTFVTGHEDPTKPESDLDWASLAATPGTLVFLMGVGAMERNAARLIAHGMPADTPAAVISDGTRPGQRTVVAPLAGLAQAAAGMRPPAIMLVGAVAALHEQLGWFERRPLHGRRVLVTRARAQASGLAAAARGARRGGGAGAGDPDRAAAVSPARARRATTRWW